MKRISRYAMVGVLFYLIFLISTIPATFVTNMVLDKKGPLQLYGVSGSIWSGKAGILQLDDKQIEKFNWNLNILPLIAGTIKLDYSFKVNKSSAEGTIGLKNFGSGGKYIENTKLNISSDDVNDILPIPQPLKLAGPINVDIEEIEISEDGVPTYALAQVNWTKATAILGDKSYSLGAFDLSATTEDDKVFIALKDLKKDGPIEAKLSAEIQENGITVVSGLIGTRKTADKKLAGFASMLMQGKKQKIINHKGNIKEPGKLISGILAGK